MTKKNYIIIYPYIISFSFSNLVYHQFGLVYCTTKGAKNKCFYVVVVTIIVVVVGAVVVPEI
jgi:hypothetical protein